MEPSTSTTRKWLPIRGWAPRYRRSWLRGDIVAGAVVAGLAIPQALGYATIAGLPVQVGLYSLAPALLMYAAFGSSRSLVVGPVSTVAVLCGTLIAAFRPASETEAVMIAGAMTIGSGVLLIAASLLRVGWMAEFLSKPIITGFVLGLTVLVIIGELPSILGIAVPPGDVAERIHLLVTGIDEAHVATVALGVVALTILFLGARLVPAVPWALVVLVGGIVASAVLDLPARGVAVVGDVPQGLPGLSWPTVPGDRTLGLIAAAAAVAFVGLAEGLSAARLFAGRTGDRVDADQDLLAFGMANLGSGVAGGMPVAGSLSKTAAAARAGGRTQVAGLATAVLALVTVLLLAPLLRGLPTAVLSAIVINAVWGLIDLPALARYRRLRTNDFVAACAAAIGVLAFGPMQGLLLAILLSVLGLVYRSSRVDVEVMGRIPGEKAAWGGTRNHPERKPVAGVMVLRSDVPLFWVNASTIQEAILTHVDRALAESDEQPIVAVVVDLEGTHQLDTTTADMLQGLLEQLRHRGLDLYLVRIMFPVRVVLRRCGFIAELGEDHLWHSISQGVRAARIEHGLKVGSIEFDGGYARSADELGERSNHRFGDLAEAIEHAAEGARADFRAGYDGLLASWEEVLGHEVDAAQPGSTEPPRGSRDQKGGVVPGPDVEVPESPTSRRPGDARSAESGPSSS